MIITSIIFLLVVNIFCSMIVKDICLDYLNISDREIFNIRMEVLLTRISLIIPPIAIVIVVLWFITFCVFTMIQFIKDVWN